MTATYWFESGLGRDASSGTDQEPYTATVRFSGHRVDVAGPRRPADDFVKDEIIEDVVPMSGPVSITTRVHDINPGEWTVTADLLNPSVLSREQRRRQRSAPPARLAIEPAAWSWRRWAIMTATTNRVRTRLAPLAAIDSQPAVIPGSWVGLVTLGAMFALAIQAILLAQSSVDVSRAWLASAASLLVGLVGGKTWYLAQHQWAWRATWRTSSPCDGMAIQGFLLGAVIGGVAALALLDLPIGTVLDATSPGVFLGVMIGRLGCFFTGCCAGRPTASRWSVWSSDRRVGARRVPAQLLESGLGAVVGLTAWILYPFLSTAISGSLFVASWAAYTLGRQFVMRLRAQSPEMSLKRRVTVGIAAFVLIADVAQVLVGRMA